MFKGVIFALLAVLLVCSPLIACDPTVFSITVKVTGMGRVTTDPAGIYCSNTDPDPSHTESCSRNFDASEEVATEVTFTNEPATGWRLVSSTDVPDNFELGKKYVLEFVFGPLADGDGGDGDEPANMVITDLSVAPHVVGPGVPVTIVVTVQNTGQLSGDKQIVLSIEGPTEDTRTEDTRDVVALAGGDSATKSFTVSRDESGIYVVEVDGYGSTDQFEVVIA